LDVLATFTFEEKALARDNAMSSILVLDDRLAYRELLATVLRYADYDVHALASGDEALQVARDERPDLIITDIVMPSMSGYEFVRRLRQDPDVGDTTVAFCTADHLDEEVGRLAAACGVSHFISNPSDPRAIIQTVGEILGSAAVLGPEDDGDFGFDREQLHLLVDKLIEKVRELDAANLERRRLVGQLITTHEDERRGIAESIHDGSIQAVLAVGMRLETLIRNGNETPSALEELRVMVADAADGLRGVLIDLQPVDIGREGLANALAIQLEQARDEDGLAYDFDNTLEHQPAEPAQTVLYRAAREALTNVRKHAGASRVHLVLEEHDGGFVLTVQDDGGGFAPEQALRVRPGHLGLPALRERVETAGGWLRLDSRPGAGSKLNVWLPRRDAE
jgi:signal transduction histidine kinase